MSTQDDNHKSLKDIASRSKRYDSKIVNQVVSDLQSQIEQLKNHYDQHTHLGGLSKESTKGLTASQIRSLNELARVNRIKINLNDP